MLKKPKPSQKGLKKLPTEVRNKMGYMKDGGSLYDMAKKMKPSGRVNADDLKKAKEMMEKRPSKFTAPKRQPMQTGPYSPSSPERKRMMQKLGNKFAGSMASQIGGGLKKPMESVFQKLKKAQMLRKRKGK